jgi:hypothetical protein
MSEHAYDEKAKYDLGKNPSKYDKWHMKAVTNPYYPVGESSEVDR